jgi:hypothetical protein
MLWSFSPEIATGANQESDYEGQIPCKVPWGILLDVDLDFYPGPAKLFPSEICGG